MKLESATSISCADTQSGIRIVRVRAAGIESQAYDFGAIPTRVDPGR